MVADWNLQQHLYGLRKTDKKGTRERRLKQWEEFHPLMSEPLSIFGYTDDPSNIREEIDYDEINIKIRRQP